MTGHVYETGLAPAIAWVLNVAAQVGVAGVAAYALTPEDIGPSAELPPDLADCANAIEAGEGLTPGALSMALQQLDTFDSVANAKFSGPQLGAARKTIQNLRALLQQTADDNGVAINQCHVRASMLILTRQFAKMSALMPAPNANDTPPPEIEQPPQKTNWMPWAAAAAAAVSIGVITWSATR